ncbi:alpha/beta hydrolase [Flavobacterium magnum]|uniref:Alpha/beta hydrolase n=1 Tax=Flavobacterium magnum TaxID=2162713 RepID=A0A2S0RHG9_9FLAO|nr:alpha/beta hydrolase [Flavobacterium magnum]AWA31065.1 alpha/beta hydrolase [Flavobacterium magnum]
MSKIYIFSGLGVDRRVFDNIDFGDLDIEFVEWIEPIKNENLENYAKRISKKIVSANPILVGLSFGGILAVEISKFLKPRKIILIASAKTRYELPKIYRVAGKMKLNKLLPSSMLKMQNFITNWFFGVETKDDKLLLNNVLIDTNPKFLRWAINEIVNWKNETYPENYIHLHGTKDQIIPIENVNVNFEIKNGGHFMTVNKPKEIETILKNACL